MDLQKDLTHENDPDPGETAEWLDALKGALDVWGEEGPRLAHHLIEKQIEFARLHGEHLPFSAATPYINTISLDSQPPTPGDQNIERRIRSYTRWNALAMVLRAGKNTNVGGHIASFAPAAPLSKAAFNPSGPRQSKTPGGDLTYFQGHSSPGVYARA